jgi:hypothetical protein
MVVVYQLKTVFRVIRNIHFVYILRTQSKGKQEGRDTRQIPKIEMTYVMAV